MNVIAKIEVALHNAQRHFNKLKLIIHESDL